MVGIHGLHQIPARSAAVTRRRAAVALVADRVQLLSLSPSCCPAIRRSEIAISGCVSSARFRASDMVATIQGRAQGPEVL